MNIAIKIDNLVKSYAGNTVIKDISFTVKKGETFALLGTNGAGKTTTLECIEGIRSYDSGSITINGSVGVQLQSSSLPAHITSIEAFKLFCKWNKTHVNLELLDTFGLRELKNKQYKEMSTGQKRRLHLALALINNPEILFLDEPTAGLDVEGRVSLHKKIRNLQEQGKTIIMASHDMAEVESLCHRIAIIRGGEIAFIGTAQELTCKVENQSKIYIKTTNCFRLQGFKSCNYEGIKQEYYMFTAINIGDALLEILQAIKETENTIIDVRIERETLEKRFMDIAKEVN